MKPLKILATHVRSAMSQTSMMHFCLRGPRSISCQGTFWEHRLIVLNVNWNQSSRTLLFRSEMSLCGYSLGFLVFKSGAGVFLDRHSYQVSSAYPVSILLGLFAACGNIYQCSLTSTSSARSKSLGILKLGYRRETQSLDHPNQQS